MMVWMPDGSGHELRATDQPRLIGTPAPDNLYAVDGSRIRYQKSSQTLFMPDGSRYLMGAGKYIDRNGNTLTFSNGVRDTLDRQINNPLPFNPGSTPLSPVDQNYSLPGVEDSSLNYTLKWRQLADVLTTSQPLRFIADSACPPGTGAFSPNLFGSDFSGRTCFGNGGVLFNPVVLSQIVLPNGQSYTFTYDIYGTIEKVVLPSGGYERFVHAYVPPVSSPSNFKFVYAQANRGVTQHVVSPSGLGNDEAQWLYSGGLNFVSMTAPDGTRVERYLWADGVSGWGYSADSSRAGRVYDERVYSASGQMLRRKLTDWAMTPSNATGNPPGAEIANRNARIVREVDFFLDTAGAALARSRTYGYDTTHQYDVGVEQTSVNEFGFVEIDQTTAQTLSISSLSTIPNGTLLRTTEIDYLTGNLNYRSLNLLALPTASRVKNGAGNIVAQTTWSYDETAFPPLTYPSVVGWTSPATNFRGNVTTITSWLNFNGSTLSIFPQGTYLATHTQYDQCGSVRKIWDARDTSLVNPSQFEYSDTYHRAYVTSQTSSDPDTSGPLTSLTSSIEYDFSTGLVTATVDANSQSTTFAYNDSLNRIKQVVKAATDASAKTQTTYLYDDVARTVTTTSDLNTYNDNLLKTVSVYDGIARLQETKRFEGVSNYISVQNQYDALGRPFKTSNPFRPWQNETAVWTTQAFDALGRVVSVTTPDNAVVTTSYSGNTETVTDQAGKARKSVTDVLGRLIKVYEDPNGLNYETSYTYDVLDNLVKVTQGAQQRFFMYDSLKRLIRARNPEQGTLGSLNLSDPLTGNSAWSIGYQYDANSNLAQKTDARGVVSTYVYDALNRSTTLNYSDTAINPDVKRFYDGATNGKGRFWYVYSGGDDSAGANVDHTAIDSYDALGRPLVQRQLFKLNNVWSGPYQTLRAYNRAGGVTSQTYPSGHAVTYNYDPAGRVADKDAQNLAFTGNLGDGVPRTYARGNTYSAWGGLSREQFGTNAAVYNKLHYNIRGQLCDVRASNANDEWGGELGALVNHYSTLWAHCGSGPDNNGNVLMSQTIINSYYMEDRYSYDSLNRLTAVNEWQNGATNTGSQQYSYDRWGNRTINPASWGAGINNKQFTVDTATNRLGVPGGQPGVMSYDAAGNLTTDTYTGAGAREYDAENRMKRAWGGNNQWQEYTYNADGQRTRRKLDGVETWQAYGFDGELLAEYAANAPAATPQKEYGYRNGQLLVTAEAGATGATNVALAANGATASASSTWSNPPFSYLPAAVNNGDHRGLNAGNNSNWTSNGTSLPQWVEVAFNGSQTINRIDVFSLQDNYQNPIEPSEATTFSLYGLTAFEVQYWNGSSFVPVPGGSVTGNNKVWKKLTFTPLTTTKIRVLISGTSDGWSRVVEVEAWTPGVIPNAALISNGATVSASSTLVSPPLNYPVTAVGDGDRKGLNAGNGGNWHSSTATFPQWVEIAFNGSKTINEVDVFSLQDNYGNPVEPTEATTFSLYGLTGFEVQYWNGSAWVTVPGGSVTGNNKVWKKLTFSPLTTTKIRILITATADGWSRIVEVEAWSPLTADINWLISDHLGTPRMIIDQTGALANIKRHDYLPFGEELFAPTGGRSAALGYSSGDDVRQQFTLKERDIETGLDYFLARYYSSVQGRFTSPDPFGGSGFVSVPQSWNKYTYCLNRPFVFTDPSGQIWLTTDDQNYIWVDDKEYEKDKEKWKDYRVGNGATVQYASSTACPECSGYKSGSWVQLNADGTVSQVADPTTTIRAQYDEQIDQIFAQLGTFREGNPLKGPPGGSTHIDYEQGGSQTRYYDQDGRPWVDIDRGHDHGAGDPHVHWWDWNKPSNPRGRGEPIPWGWEMWDNGDYIPQPRESSFPVSPLHFPSRSPVRTTVPLRPMILRPILVP